MTAKRETQSAGTSLWKTIAWAVFLSGLTFGACITCLVIHVALNALHFETSLIQERLVRIVSAIAAVLFCIIGIVSPAAAHQIGGTVDDIAAMLTRLKEWDNPSD